MKRYLQIVWENLFLKTFDFKGRTNCSAYITCTIFWWIIFLLSIPCFVLMDFGYDFLGIIAGVLSAIALYLQLIPFTSLRVRRLHDIGERGSKLIIIYLVVLIAPLGLGFIWMWSHMYEKSAADFSQRIDIPVNEGSQSDCNNGAVEVEDVEL